MDTLKKAELTALMCYIERCLKSRIPIYNSEVPDTAGKKTTRRRTQAIGKRFAFHANTKRRRQAIAKRYAFQANAINVKGGL